MAYDLNANYRAIQARQARFPRVVYRQAISDPFIADASMTGAWRPAAGFSGMGEGESFLDGITAKLKSTVDIAGMQVPVWGLVAAGVGALFFLKK